MILPFFINLQELPSVIEIFEAVGVVVTLILVVINLIKLTRKDRDRQKQIESLAELAEEAKEGNQINKESNQILTNFVVHIAKLAASSHEAAIIQRQKNEFEIQQHKNQIKPRIKTFGGGKSGNFWHFALKNNGGKCRVVDLRKGDNNRVVLISLNELKRTEFEPGKKYEVKWRLRSTKSDPDLFAIDLTLTLEDEEKNFYAVKFTGSARHPNASDPIEISRPENHGEAGPVGIDNH